MTFTITEIQTGTGPRKLKEPMVAERIETLEGGVLWELNFDCFWSKRKGAGAAKVDLEADLAWTWETYAEEDDANLSPAARKLKQKLLSMVEDEQS